MNELVNKQTALRKKESKEDNTLESKQMGRIKMFHHRIVEMQLLNQGSEAECWFPE